MNRIGKPVDTTKVSEAEVPIVFAVQPQGYVAVETPEELKEWEEDVLALTGAKLTITRGGAYAYGYSCSGGCLDDCCQYRR